MSDKFIYVLVDGQGRLCEVLYSDYAFDKNEPVELDAVPIYQNGELFKGPRCEKKRTFIHKDMLHPGVFLYIQKPGTHARKGDNE